MSFVNPATNELNLKLVYCGPPGSGKRTNLQYLFDKNELNARQIAHELPTGDEVTMVDFVLPGVVVRGFELRFMLYALGGEVASAESLQRVLTGVDGIIFVVDSRVEQVDPSLESFEALQGALEQLGLDLDTLPLVLQFNKYDSPDAVVFEVLRALFPQVPGVQAVAMNGVGVFDCLKLVAKLVLAGLQP